MDKNKLEQYVTDGISYREIAQREGVSKGTVEYWVKKHQLNHLLKKPKRKNLYFDKIDSKEKAYFLGFVLGDGHIDLKDVTTVRIQLQDKVVLENFVNWFGGQVIESHKVDKKNHRFPYATWARKISDIRKFTSGRLKQDRRIPIIPKEFERYLLQGFFDAEGSVTFGLRKDRSTLWKKITFTSSLKNLEGIQQILLKRLDIATVIRPKTGEDCFVLEFAAAKNILKFLDFIYPDSQFIILPRKYSKSKALRLELGEFGERGTKESSNPEPSL